MASLSQSVSQLDATWKALCRRWEAAQAAWNDPVRLAFEKEYWAPLEQQMPTTQRKMQRLATLA